MFQCHACNSKFDHSELLQLDMLGFRLRLKPNFPPESIEMECPKCGHAGRYGLAVILQRSEGA
jgi:hypothetical protein